MNIFENYYCSRCMKLLCQEENTCPYCGYKSPATIDQSYFLEEGTLFLGGRYEIGAVYNENHDYIRYSAWDYRDMVPVIIKEYFPKAIVHRNAECNDTVFVIEAGQIEFRSEIDRIYSVSENAFKKNNTVYQIENHPAGSMKKSLLASE